VAIVAALSGSTVAHAAFSYEGQDWYIDSNGDFCGTSPFLFGGWNGTCYIPFTYSGDFVNRGWDASARYAAYEWCYAADPDHGNSQDFCWLDNYPGTITNGIGVSGDIGDLGGRHANGVIPLGIAWYSSYCGFPFTDRCDMNDAHIRISDNSLLTDPNANDLGSGCKGEPEWYWIGGPGNMDGCRYSMIQNTEHEYGHTVGLAHPINGPNSNNPIMQCVQGPGDNRGPSTDDLNGLRWIYGGQDSARWGSPISSPC
jgi:hypothetical protein